MKIEGSVQEIKELFKNFEIKKTPVAGTTDVIKLDGKNISNQMLKKSMLYLYKALKEEGLQNTDEFINFWEKY